MFKIVQTCDRCGLEREVHLPKDSNFSFHYELLVSVRRANGWFPIKEKDLCDSCLIKLFEDSNK